MLPPDFSLFMPFLFGMLETPPVAPTTEGTTVYVFFLALTGIAAAGDGPGHPEGQGHGQHGQLPPAPGGGQHAAELQGDGLPLRAGAPPLWWTPVSECRLSQGKAEETVIERAPNTEIEAVLIPAIAAKHDLFRALYKCQQPSPSPNNCPDLSPKT